MKIKYDDEFKVYKHFCPGCNEIHYIPNFDDKPHWDFNNDFENYPTFSPSVKHTWSDSKTCHYFIRNGAIEFCSDCTHSLAGQTVPLPELKEAL